MIKSKKITLDSRIYPVEAVLNAAYIFIDRAYIFLDSKLRNKITVFIKGKKRISQRQLDCLAGEFMNELLHSALRCAVSKNNKKIREYIVGRALSSALPFSGFGPDAASAKLDYQEDPLGIAVPWEDKYGKKKNAQRKKV